MQIVIDVTEKEYENIRLMNCIAQGRILPKGHGRLIDANDLLDRIGLEDNDGNREDNVGEIITLEDFDFIPTIIEADDEEIRVGDEVYIINENNKSVVTNIFNASHGPVAMLLSGDAKWIDVGLQYLNKTGKHYDAIEEVLKELRGDEE